jgi:hypothetical protein
MKMILPLAALVCLTSLADPTLGDDCFRTNDDLLIFRPGEHHTGAIEFKFESRVQRFDNIARKYTWCIENVHQYHITQFMWGTENRPEIYFSGSVEPGKMVPQILTDSSKVLLAPRRIKFGRQYIGAWDAIDRETVFPEQLVAQAPGAIDLEQVPNRAGVDATEANKETLIDLEGLTRDATRLNLFLRDNKIELFSSTVATVPARKDVLSQVINQKYETYKPGDFARLDVRLSNEIRPSAEGPISTVYLNVLPETESDRRIMSTASKDAPLRIEVSAIDPASRAVDDLVKWSGTLETGALQKQLLSYPAKDLEYANVMITIGTTDSNFKFAAVPARILVPGRR